MCVLRCIRRCIIGDCVARCVYLGVLVGDDCQGV